MPPTHDFILEMLVSLAHKHDMEVGVTLNVPGAVLSGLLVSREKWLAALADSQESGTTAHAMIDGLRHGLGAIKALPDDDSYSFIHLEGTRLVDGAGIAPTASEAGYFWRGRPSEVAGWSFGVFGPTGSP